MEIKDRVKQVRKAQGLTQQKFADRLRMAKPSISAIEYGTSNMSERTILSICKEFNVNEDWLRTGKGEMFNPKDFEEEVAEIVWDIVAQNTFSEEEKEQYIELIKIISKSSGDNIDALLRIAKGLQNNTPSN